MRHARRSHPGGGRLSQNPKADRDKPIQERTLPNLKRLRRSAELMRSYARSLGTLGNDRHQSAATSGAWLIVRTVGAHWTNGPRRTPNPEDTERAATILELCRNHAAALLEDHGPRTRACGPRLASELAARALERMAALPRCHLENDGPNLADYLWDDHGSVTARLHVSELADCIAAVAADAGTPAPPDGYTVEARYAFDETLTGWAQIDTAADAWYFGSWTEPMSRQILCYAEGDVAHTVAADATSYLTELEALAEFHRKNDKWMGIDAERSSKAGLELQRIGAGHLLRWTEDDKRSVLERATDGEYAPSAYDTDEGTQPPRLRGKTETTACREASSDGASAS